MTLRRQAALALAAHARWVMPDSRSSWGDGMAREVDHIDQDGPAMRWAWGAVFAAYLERATVLCQAGFSRVLLTLPILFEATRAVFAQCLTVAWRMQNLSVATSLGSMTPGDDYRRFTPLMKIIPDWYIALGFLSGILFVASAVQLLRRNRSAFVLFSVALGIELAAEGLVRLVPGYSEAAGQVWGFSDSNFRRDVLIPVASNLLPFLIGAAVWLASRGMGQPKVQSGQHNA